MAKAYIKKYTEHGIVYARFKPTGRWKLVKNQYARLFNYSMNSPYILYLEHAFMGVFKRWVAEDDIVIPVEMKKEEFVFNCKTGREE